MPPPPAWSPADGHAAPADACNHPDKLLVPQSTKTGTSPLPGGGEGESRTGGGIDLDASAVSDEALGHAQLHAPATGVQVGSTLAMAEGTEDNPWSYYQNSQMQGHLFKRAESIYSQEIQKLALDCLPDPDQVLCLADLGCSSGMNTISNMSAVYDEVSKRYAASGRSVPQTMAFFSDLPTNDFNSLFRLLKPPESCLAVAGEFQDSKPPGAAFFVAGAPGTFYGKLFPRKMLHLVMSTFSVHWISQIPPRLCDNNSPAFNRGGIWLPEPHRPEVEKEYAQQFRKDLCNFLVLRVQEVAKGGLLMLQLAAKQERKRAKPDWIPPFGALLEDAWNQLVEEGHFDPVQRDAFNMPIYLPSVDEMKVAIDDANSRMHTAGTSDRWEIKRLEYYKLNPFGPKDVLKADAHSFAMAGCRMIRSVVNGLVQRHLGPSQTDALFRRVGDLAAHRAHELIERLDHAGIVAILSCK